MAFSLFDNVAKCLLHSPQLLGALNAWEAPIPQQHNTTRMGDHSDHQSLQSLCAQSPTLQCHEKTPSTQSPSTTPALLPSLLPFLHPYLSPFPASASSASARCGRGACVRQPATRTYPPRIANACSVPLAKKLSRSASPLLPSGPDPTCSTRHTVLRAGTAIVAMERDVSERKQANRGRGGEGGGAQRHLQRPKELVGAAGSWGC